MGNASATALAATLNWILRDGAGMLGSLAFSTWGSSRFDLDVKTWRLFADIINDIALSLEFLAPALGKDWFLPILCVSSLCKALCGVAAGCTRGVISQHFAGPSGGTNLSDVAAKESTQETAVRFVALLVGWHIAPLLLADPTTATTAFVTLTLAHVAANYVGVSSLALTTLNANRFDAVLAHMVAAVSLGHQREVEAAPMHVQMESHRLSDGAHVFIVHHATQVTAAGDSSSQQRRVVGALQEYSHGLHVRLKGADSEAGWVDHIASWTAEWIAFLNSLAAWALSGVLGLLWCWAKRNSPPVYAPASQHNTPAGLAALVPSPIQIATTESLFPAQNWSCVVWYFRKVLSLLQLQTPLSHAKLNLGASLAALRPQGTPHWFGMQCCRTAIPASQSDQKVAEAAITCLRSGQAWVLVLRTESGCIAADSINILLPDGDDGALKLESYAAAALLRPHLHLGLLSFATKASVRDSLRTCVTAARACHACLAACAGQEAQYSRKWRLHPLLVPDQGWRCLATKQSASSPKASTSRSRSAGRRQKQA